jgi:hypothetical protein
MNERQALASNRQRLFFPGIEALNRSRAERADPQTASVT